MFRIVDDNSRGKGPAYIVVEGVVMGRRRVTGVVRNR